MYSDDQFVIHCTVTYVIQLQILHPIFTAAFLRSRDLRITFAQKAAVRGSLSSRYSSRPPSPFPFHPSISILYPSYNQMTSKHPHYHSHLGWHGECGVFPADYGRNARTSNHQTCRHPCKLARPHPKLLCLLVLRGKIASKTEEARGRRI